MARRHELPHIRRRQEASGAIGDAKGISQQLRALLPQDGVRVEEIVNLSAYPGRYQENVYTVVRTKSDTRWRGHEFIVLQIPKTPDTEQLKAGDVLTELPARTGNSGIVHHPATGIREPCMHEGRQIDNTDFHRILEIMERHKREDAAAKS